MQTMPRPERAPRFSISLQRLAVILSVTLTGLTLLACVALKAITARDGRHLQRLYRAGEAQQAVYRTRTHLLEFSRLSQLILTTHDDNLEPRRVDAMADVLTELDTLRSFVEPARLPAVDQAGEQVRAYFGERHRVELAGGGPERALVAVTPMLDAAGATLNDLADAESSRTASELESAFRWRRVGDLIGWVVAALVVVGSIFGLAVLYWTGVRGVIRLTDTIKRFGHGDREIRADATSASEVASAAVTFNEMAETITGQQTRMLDFLGSVAKDLKNPLGVISMAVADLAPGKAAPAPEKAQMRIATVNREVAHLTKLIDAFLDAGRAEWQSLNLQQPRRDLGKLLADVVKTYETFSTMHEVSLSEPDQPVWVRFDVERLSQVLHTLLSNAIQYSPRGGTVEVALTTDVDDTREATVRVTDHGIGVPPDQIKEIFEPFGRITGPRQPSGASWVALSVARRIVEAHGGRLDVESKTGEGTTFRVQLPLAVAPTVEAISASAEHPSPGAAAAGASH
jgi:two-component system, OmpR family, sensor histidine kinase MtrB